MVNTTLTLENTPSYLLQLGEVLCRIEQMLSSSQTAGNNSDKPLTTEEAADFLDLEVVTLYSLVQKRKVPFHKRGKKLYFFKEELIEWIRSGGSSAADKVFNQLEETFLAANKRKGGRI